MTAIGICASPTGGPVEIRGDERDVREVLVLLGEARRTLQEPDPLQDAIERNIACLRAWERLEACEVRR